MRASLAMVRLLWLFGKGEDLYARAKLWSGEKKVILVGQTGVGKSFIGNALLQNEEFKVLAGEGESVTIWLNQSIANVDIGEDTIRLTVFDTPGLGDTKGRSLAFVDIITDAIRKERPDALIIVTDDKRFGLELKVGLRALKECLGDAIVPGRIIVLANKMVTPFQLENADPGISDKKEQEKEIYRLTLKRLEDVSAMMGFGEPPSSPLAHVVANSAESKDGLPMLHDIVRRLPSSRWNVEGVKTFTEAFDSAKDAVSNQSKALQQAEVRLEQLQGLSTSLRADLENAMADHKRAVVMTGVGAVGGIVAGGAMFISTIATGGWSVVVLGGTTLTSGAAGGYVAYSASLKENLAKRIRGTEAEIAECEDVQHHAELIKAKAQKFLREMEELKAVLNARLTKSKVERNDSRAADL